MYHRLCSELANFCCFAFLELFVDTEMFRQTSLVLVSFAALVALERFQPGVRSHVPLQMTRISGSLIALVTFELLFSCMHPHHVLFQFTSSNAGKLARCASVRLLTRVGSFVPLQIAR